MHQPLNTSETITIRSTAGIRKGYQLQKRKILLSNGKPVSPRPVSWEKDVLRALFPAQNGSGKEAERKRNGMDIVDQLAESIMVRYRLDARLFCCRLTGTSRAPTPAIQCQWVNGNWRNLSPRIRTCLSFKNLTFYGLSSRTSLRDQGSTSTKDPSRSRSPNPRLSPLFPFPFSFFPFPFYFFLLPPDPNRRSSLTLTFTFSSRSEVNVPADR